MWLTMSKSVKLTAAQERFVQEWHKTGNKSEAYRNAYPRSKKWKENSLNSAATKLSQTTKVSQRYEELQKATSERNKYDVDQVLKMYYRAYVRADQSGKIAAMNTAARNIAEICGLLPTQKHKHFTDDGEGGDAPLSASPIFILPSNGREVVNEN